MLQTPSRLEQLAVKLARERYRRTGIPFPFERLSPEVQQKHYLDPALLDLQFLEQEGLLVP